jgi:DASS family divalent anion:Na+ symporter
MNKNLVRALVTVAVGAAIWFAPVPAGVKPQAWHLFAIFVSTILGFILQPLPMGSIAIISLTFTALVGVLKPAEVLSGFANGTIWLIVAAFLFARGFIKSGLGRRIAFKFMSLLGGSTLSLGYSLVASDLVISMATPSNTARAAHPLSHRPQPQLRLRLRAGRRPPRFGAYMMQTVYQGNVVTSAMFMTAMAGNPLCVELARKTLNLNITWVDWAVAAIVPGLISLIVVPYVLYLIYPPEIKKTPEAKEIAAAELAKMGPMSAAEKIVAGAFVLALALWVAAGLKKVLPWVPVVDATIVALLAVSIMLVTKVLDWKDVLDEKGAWDTLVWMGTIVGLAGFLAKLGFIPWFAKTVSAGIAGVAWVPALGILLAVYMYAHYASPASPPTSPPCTPPSPPWPWPQAPRRCLPRWRSPSFPILYVPNPLCRRPVAHLLQRRLPRPGHLVAARLHNLGDKPRHLGRPRLDVVENPRLVVK